MFIQIIQVYGNYGLNNEGNNQKYKVINNIQKYI